jgi:hypothetical protein
MRLSGAFPLSKLFLYQLPDNLFDLLIVRYPPEEPGFSMGSRLQRMRKSQGQFRLLEPGVLALPASRN